MNYRQPFQGEYPITQRYGELIPGVTYKDRPHTGIDYGCPELTTILASAEGEVMFADYDETGYGYTVILQHPDGRATLYAHLAFVSVHAGETVSQGERIGYSGASGNATGPHLHFEARKVWSDWHSHFDPMTLPLMCVDDAEPVTDCHQLKGADAFEAGDMVEVQNDLGVKAFFDPIFSYERMTTYQKGQQFYYTGDSVARTVNGRKLTYMRVVPATFSVWVAVNDGDTQLLDK